MLLIELVKPRPWRSVAMFWFLIRMRLSGRSEIKQRHKNNAVGSLIKGLDDKQLSNAVEHFSTKVASIYRQEVLASIEQVTQDDGIALVVTASPSFAVRHCVVGRSVVVIGTEFEKNDGIYTGRVKGKNCYGEEKVSRLNSWAAGSDQELNVRSAWGDHPSDFDMVSLAERRYWVIRGNKYYTQIVSIDPDATFMFTD